MENTMNAIIKTATLFTALTNIVEKMLSIAMDKFFNVTPEQLVASNTTPSTGNQADTPSDGQSVTPADFLLQLKNKSTSFIACLNRLNYPDNMREVTECFTQSDLQKLASCIQDFNDIISSAQSLLNNLKSCTDKPAETDQFLHALSDAINSIVTVMNSRINMHNRFFSVLEQNQVDSLKPLVINTK
jgi:hypothetical protein